MPVSLKRGLGENLLSRKLVNYYYLFNFINSQSLSKHCFNILGVKMRSLDKAFHSQEKNLYDCLNCESNSSIFMKHHFYWNGQLTKCDLGICKFLNNKVSLSLQEKQCTVTGN